MKTRIKIAFLLAVTACFLGIITSFSTMFVSTDNNPNIALEEFRGYISDGDYMAVVEMTGNSVDSSDAGNDGSVEGLIISMMLKNVKIDVLSEPDVNGTIAWQPVRISHVDMSFLMKKLFSGVIKETGDYEWNHGSYQSDDEINQAIAESIATQLNGNFRDCVITEKINLEYHYRDGKWLPVMTRDLYRALTGNIDDASESLDEYVKKWKENQS